MATFEILHSDAPYYTIRVSFSDLEYEQLITSNKKGAELASQLQGYADEMEEAVIPLTSIEKKEL